MLKLYKKNNYVNNKMILIFCLLLLAILFLTIGYSTYVADFSISNVVATVRADKVVRVTDARVINGVVNSIDYYTDGVISSVTMSTNNTITYEVTITNYGNVPVAISDISISDGVNKIDNVTYTLNDYTLKNKICNNNECTGNISKTFSITLTNNGNDLVDSNLMIDFVFSDVYDITYVGFSNITNLPTEVVSGDTKTINFTLDIPDGVIIDGTYGKYTYSNGVLTITNVISSLTITKATSLITYINNLVSGNTKTSTNIITLSSSDTCTNTLAYDGTSDNNLRYVGADPCNYVSFNGEVWRIIGIMNNITTNSGSTESRIKLIRSTPIGSFAMDSTDTKRYNDWNESTLKDILNSGAYYGPIYTGEDRYISDTYNAAYKADSWNTIDLDFSLTGIKADTKNYFSSVVWNLGGVSDSNASYTASEFYEAERSSNVYSNSNIHINKSTWTGEIGLPYVSDYGFATGSSSRSTCLSVNLGKAVSSGYGWRTLNNDTYTSCKTSNWLYNDMWTLVHYTSSRNTYFNISTDSSVGWRAAHNRTNVYPVVYLKNDVLYNGGSGTENDKYTITISSN